MKYFIGAKDKNGLAFIADIVEAENFDAACTIVIVKAIAQKGRGNFRITAVNEQPADAHVFAVVDEKREARALEDFERFVMFFSVAASEYYSIDDLIKIFARIVGWDENRARSAFEVCVVKGHIDQK